VAIRRTADEEVHDDVGVVPEAVGGEEHLAPGGAHGLQHRRQPRVLMHVPPRVCRHRLLQAAVAVAQIHSCADVPAMKPQPVIKGRGQPDVAAQGYGCRFTPPRLMKAALCGPWQGLSWHEHSMLA